MRAAFKAGGHASTNCPTVRAIAIAGSQGTLTSGEPSRGPVGELVGIDGGVVSGVINLEFIRR